MFYHFEPLKSVEGMGKPRIDTKPGEYIDNAIGVLSAIFRCDFSESKLMSRFLKLYSSTFPRAADTICRQTRENLEVEKSRDQFCQCNYKRVTYERLVTKPLKVAHEIYAALLE